MTSKVPCKFFLSGRCAFGDGCRFSHDTTDAAAAAAPAGTGGGRDVCKFFLAGNCAYGDQCRFQHPGSNNYGGGGGGGRPGVGRPPMAPNGGGAHVGAPPGGEWAGGGVQKWPSGAEEFGLMESSDPNPNWDDYMDPDEMEAFAAWQQEQMRGPGGGGGSYPEGADDFVDPADIPLCTEYERTGACRGGDDCPLVHGDRCQSCGLHAIHPYNPDLIAAHANDCKGAAGAAGAAAGAAAGSGEKGGTVGAGGAAAEDSKAGGAAAAAADGAGQAQAKEEVARAAAAAAAADELSAGLGAAKIHE